MHKYSIALIAALGFHASFAHALHAPPVHKTFRVVIDPGHGGQDEGAVYQDRFERISEKALTLQIAQQVGGILSTRGYSVFLTRDSDQDLPLSSRTALANKLNADVFLSIHFNSTRTARLTHRTGLMGRADGVETYILNNATDASSRRLAYLENKGLSPAAGDPNAQTDVALILKDLRIDGNLVESKRLACAIQGSVITANPTRNRGVKQALFYVLLGADMPSVLVEAGFLSSAKDRSLLLSERGQKRLSASIAKAVVLYRQSKTSPKLTAKLTSCQVGEHP